MAGPYTEAEVITRWDVDGIPVSAGTTATTPLTVTQGTLLSGEDDQADRLMVETANQYLLIATATGVLTNVAASKAYLHGVYVNAAPGATDVLDIYDDNDKDAGGATGLFLTVSLGTVGFKPIGCRTVNGIVVKTTMAAGSSNATLIYRKLA